MNGRVVRNYNFLLNIVRNTRQSIKDASNSEIGCLVEILFNIHKIAFNRSERNSIVRFLPIIRYIGKCRQPAKARDLLITFANHFIRTIVQSVLSMQ